MSERSSFHDREATPNDHDDAWVRWLSQLDDQMAGSAPAPDATRVPDVGDTPGDEAPPESPQARTAAFLRLLEEVWPRAPLGSDDLPGDAGLEPELASRTIGRFRVLGELGRGGFGVVLLAEDPTIGRQVALKVPRPEVLLTRELRERFLREARAQSLLSHPHIVPVFEAGQVGTLCYVASAYYEGTNLREWLRTRSAPVGPRQAASIVLQIAEALEHAHQRGVWHRDIKPSNVLVEEGSAPGDAARGVVARLIDFGLAKVRDTADELTRSRCQLGTPHYMAPEQAEGNLDAIGPRSDVYGAGLLLYELLCGQTHFVGQADVQVLRQIVEEDVPRPRRLRREIPRDLEAICVKCLEKRPTRRYGSAAELAADLRAYLEGRPIRARRVSSGARLVRWARRRPLPAALAAALVAAVLTGGVLVARAWRHTQAALAEAERESDRAEFRLKSAQDLLTRLVEGVRSPDEVEGAPWMNTKLNREIAAFLSEQMEWIDPARPTFEEARAWRRLASIHDDQHDPIRATHFARRALAALERLERAPGGDKCYPELLSAQVGLAAILQRAGKIGESLEAIALARELIARAPASADPHRLAYEKVSIELRALSAASKLNDDAEVSANIARIDEALRAPTGPLQGLGRYQAAVRAYCLAMGLLYKRGRLGEAIACAERAQAAIEYCVERDPRDHRTRSLQAALLRHTAQLKQRAGDYRGAIGDLRDSLRQHRRLARWYPQEAVYRASSDWQQLIGLYQAVGDTTAARWAIPEALWELEQGLLKIDAANVSLHEFSEICHVAVSLEELLGRGLRSQVWYKRATDLCAQVAESRELTVVEQLAEVRCWYHYGRDIAESPMRAKARDRLIECETRAARLLADVPEQHEARGYLARSRSWLGRISRDARRLDDAEKWFRLAAEEYRVILKQAPHEKGFAADLATCEAFLATRQPAGVASTP